MLLLLKVDMPLVLQAHAESGMVRHHRLSFTRPSGTVGSLTMSSLHMAVRLTSAAAGDKADNVATCECLDC
jgi:hypothetical protein